MKPTQVNIMKICYYDPMNCKKKNQIMTFLFQTVLLVTIIYVIRNKLYQTFSILHWKYTDVYHFNKFNWFIFTFLGALYSRKINLDGEQVSLQVQDTPCVSLQVSPNHIPITSFCPSAKPSSKVVCPWCIITVV